jgi:NADH-quinone oxidoreductase subunit M
MSEALLLNLMLWLPLGGALALLLVPKENASVVRAVSTLLLTAQFVIALVLYRAFDGTVDGLQFATSVPWIGEWGVRYSIGLDGANLLLVVLTTFLGPLVIIGATHAIEKDGRLFHVMVLLLQFAMMGAFLAQDLFLFYLFWEAMLIPMFFMIGIWGGARRSYATVKFVLYTAFGSILMLAALIYLALSLQAQGGAPSFAFADLMKVALPMSVQMPVFAAFALSFAIKVPMVPLHTWLPDSHVEAPTPGSVILAGVLLKMGTYGFLKLGFPLFPDATHAATPLLMTLSVISIVYGACLALVQTDIKKIIAYSSISHLGYVMLGLLSLDLAGIQGAIVQMVSHGIVAAGLFLLVGMIYERCHTRELASYGGLARQMPVYGVFFILFMLASVGLPTTSGFTGEFMTLLGSFNAAWPQHLDGRNLALVLSILAVTGVVLGALYMLRFALTFLFGRAKTPHGETLVDLSMRERFILGTLTIAVFYLGLFPNGALQKTELAAKHFQQAVTSAGAPVYAH